MSASEEAHELHEHAEHGAGDPKMAPVSFTMAVLAVLLAFVTLLGHRAHTEEVVLQNKASDQWSYYQAKNIRGTLHEDFVDTLGVIAHVDKEGLDQAKERMAKAAEKARDDQKEIMAKAREIEHERDTVKRHADRFDLGEGFLEVALVITSITLLTRRRVYWALGGAFGVLGVITAASAALLH